MKGEHKSKGDSLGSVMGGGKKKRESIFGERELRRGHPGNKSMADTFLGFELDRTLPSLAAYWLGAAQRNVSPPAYGKQRQRPPAPSRRHKVAIVLSLKKKGGWSRNVERSP